MGVWASWRLLKFLALCALAGGMAGVLAHPARISRLQLAYGVVLPAFLGVWVAGYGLMRESGRGFEGWILVAMGASLTSLHLVLLVAHLARPKVATSALALGALGVALAEMVVRPSGGLHLAPVAVGVLVTALGSALPAPSDPEPGAPDWLRGAVRWAGRVEGASLLALLAVSVGRRALSLELGELPALLGWTHGVLVLAWLQVLVVGGRALGWSWKRLLIGLVTLLPFGTLVLERWLSSEHAPAQVV